MIFEYNQIQTDENNYMRANFANTFFRLMIAARLVIFVITLKISLK